jgi:CxC2 like cysteine cluster associated with KDZ transposases
MDVNGIHEIGLDFCDCDRAQAHHLQILQFRWFPATVINPRTAATRRVLKHFQILSFESKVSGFEFYHSLARETDNTSIFTVKVPIPYFYEFFGYATNHICTIGSLPILHANGP